MHRILLLLMLLITCRIAVSQQIKNYNYSRLSIHDGLVSNTVNAVRQDSLGYMWILNGNTIQRYDGKRFLTFSHEPGNPYSLPEGPLSGISIDTRGRLWTIYRSFQVGYLDTRTHKFHKVKVNVSKDQLHKLGGGVFTGSNGDVILVGGDKFMFYYSEKNKEFDKKYNKFNLPDSARAMTILEDAIDHNIWACTQTGLFKYNVKKNTLSHAGHNVDKDPYIDAFASLRATIQFNIDHQGRGWVVSWPEELGMSVYSYDPKTKQKTEWQHKIGATVKHQYWMIHGFNVFSDKSLWINGDNMLAKLRNDGSAFDPIKKDAPGEYNIHFDYVYHLMEDKERNVWIATNSGLYRFNPSAQLVNHVKNDKLFDDRDYPQDVTDILQTRNGDILVSTWGEGVFHYDSTFRPTWVDHYHKTHMAGKEALTWAMHEHRSGDIWRAQQGGNLVVWRASTKTTELMTPPLFEGRTIRQISEDSRGDLWFSSQGGRIIKYDYNTKQFSLQQDLKSIVPKILIDSSDYLWACTEAIGLIKMSTKTGQILHQYLASDTAGNGLRASSVADVIQYDDTTFVISAEGLNFLNTKTNKFKYLTQRNGLPAPHISNIIKDRRGYIWMTTDAGLVSYYPPRSKISIYSANDGVNATYFINSSSIEFKNGSIGFGTAHDMMIFDPEKLTVSNYKVPRIVITGVKVGGQPLNMDSLMGTKNLELAYDQTSIQIEFSSLTYQNSYGIRYMMKDLEKKWIDATTDNQVSYNYLPPGDYTFMVASVTEMGVVGDITEISIHIDPPFWRTWWFYTLLILAAVIVLLLFDKQRIQRIKKEQEIRSSIADNLHDEVNTVLQNISVLSEIARIKAEAQPEQSKEYIYEIQQKSRNMVVAMNDVLWSINPVNDRMSKTLERISETAQALENKYSVRINIQAEDRVKSVNLPMRTRHEFILIYKLAIVTLVEELKAKETTVQLDLHKAKLHLQIFSLNVTLPKGNNIVTKNINEIKTRAASLNDGNVDIQSDDKGTWILVELKY